MYENKLFLIRKRCDFFLYVPPPVHQKRPGRLGELLLDLFRY